MTLGRHSLRGRKTSSNLFAESIHRWTILTSHLPSSTTVVKSLSVTGWSARADATKAFSQGYRSIYAALEDLQDDLKQQAATRAEAVRLQQKMCLLETIFRFETCEERTEHNNGPRWNECTVTTLH